MGPGGRAGVALRSVWAYGGQRRLLIWAIVAFVRASPSACCPRDAALTAIRGVAAAEPVADWISAHADWFETAAKIFYLLGALLLALNLWRAISFSSLLLRGAQLLNLDVRDRRRDLENRVARLNQRVAALSAEAEAAAKRAEAAARRAGGKAHARAPGPDFLERAMSRRRPRGHFSQRSANASATGRAASAPDRLVFVIDNLDALPAGAAIAWIEAAQSVIGAGSIGIMALDPARLVDPLGGPREARRRFDKWLQVVVNLPDRAGLDGERLVARLLSTDGQAAPAPFRSRRSGPRSSSPFERGDGALDRARAARGAFAARRQAVPQRLPACALLERASPGDGADAGRRLRRRRGAGGDARPSRRRSGEIGDFDGPDALVKAVKSARAANNGAISIADARAAEAIARRYACRCEIAVSSADGEGGDHGTAAPVNWYPAPASRGDVAEFTASGSFDWLQPPPSATMRLTASV